MQKKAAETVAGRSLEHHRVGGLYDSYLSAGSRQRALFHRSDDNLLRRLGHIVDSSGGFFSKAAALPLLPSLFAGGGGKIPPRKRRNLPLLPLRQADTGNGPGRKRRKIKKSPPLIREGAVWFLGIFKELFSKRPLKGRRGVAPTARH